MIEFSFMSGGLLVSFIYTSLLFLWVGILGFLSWKIYKNYKRYKTVQGTLKRSKRYVAVIVLLLFGLMVFNSANMPKRKIVTISNPAQREYNQPKDVEIVRPPPRTERLDGFRPLKENEE